MGRNLHSIKLKIIMLLIGAFATTDPLVIPSASTVCRALGGGLARSYGLGPATGMLAGLVVRFRLRSSHRFEDAVDTSELLRNLLYFRILARKPGCYRSGLPKESGGDV